MTQTEPVTTTRAALDDLQGLWRIRLLEERVRDLRLAGDIVGSVHLAIGQEAGPVGTCSILQPQDALFATYRGHGWALARGVPPAAILAELLGRADGVNGGRGGSAYFTAPRYGFYGENSIVGGGLPIAVGAALAARYDGSGRVAVTVFGDGALNQGASHEALNMAAAMRLPVLFVCENNGYSELTRIEDMVAEPQLWKRARAYGMLGRRLDGNDVAGVREAAGEAADRARSGRGPMLLELMTERLVGHYIGDAEQYRRPGELDEALAREPIRRLREALLADGVPQDELDAAEAAARREIDEATQQALASPAADPATAEEHLYG
jgi:TPP-dependent pyruvate/acetoin dehydrogenase alpha subunit